MKNKKESLGYNLFVDKEMDDLFGMFYPLFISYLEFMSLPENTNNPERRINLERLNKLGETYDRFLDVTGDASHKLGWCNDPNCSWVPGEKAGTKRLKN